ncbi:uncharacterized protein VTP21DRAFT_44 [Calcarisporiella thermophila]|uniref:uncharacterized protein n=1 Tax=Calcarisporiella thermophila TaxID=911321 RepID=UPI00374241C0
MRHFLSTLLRQNVATKSLKNPSFFMPRMQFNGSRLKKDELRAKVLPSSMTPINRYERLSSLLDTFSALKTKPLPSNAKELTREIVLKRMKDSYVEEILPVKSNPSVAELYCGAFGKMRLGRLWEDLDSLAGVIAYKHADDGHPNSRPLTIVTASVDRIEMLSDYDLETDYKLSGHVTYVGYSSIEVFMKMERLPVETDNNSSKDISNETGGIIRAGNDTVLLARFTMVAKDAATGASAQVNPLRLDSPAERRLFQLGEEMKQRKRVAAEEALTRRPPTPEERLLVHDLYLEYSKYDDPSGKITLPPATCWMNSTRMESVYLMQFDDRNIHGFIFGGYLMRRAHELALSNASLFLGTHPKFLALDQISFHAPVPIGSVLKLVSEITYAEGGEHKSFQVSVEADVMDVKTGDRKRTNVFHFTWEAPDGVKVPRVIPRTYAESMKFVEGRRRKLLGVRSRALNRAFTEK